MLLLVVLQMVQSSRLALQQPFRLVLYHLKTLLVCFMPHQYVAAAANDGVLFNADIAGLTEDPGTSHNVCQGSWPLAAVTLQQQHQEMWASLEPSTLR